MEREGIEVQSSASVVAVVSGGVLLELGVPGREGNDVE